MFNLIFSYSILIYSSLTSHPTNAANLRIKEGRYFTVELPGRSGRLLPHDPHRPGRADFPHPVPLITVLLNVVVPYFWHWKWIMFEKIFERVPASFTFPRSPIKPLSP